jgi:tryptophan-rich sensory protein
MLTWFKKIFGDHETSLTEKIISTGGAAVFLTLITLLMHIKTNKIGYANLVKPEAQLPPSLMGLGWFIVFAFLIVAAFFAWNHYASNRARVAFAVFFGLNGMLLSVWGKWMFGTLQLDKALVGAMLLVIFAEGLTLSAHYSSSRASHYTLPYLAWMVYQTYLTASLILMN